MKENKKEIANKKDISKMTIEQIKEYVNELESKPYFKPIEEYESICGVKLKDAVYIIEKFKEMGGKPDGLSDAWMRGYTEYQTAWKKAQEDMLKRYGWE